MKAVSCIQILVTIGFLCVLAACGVDQADSSSSGDGPDSALEDKPNIILFLVDDMGLMDTSVPMLTDATSKPQRHPLNDWYQTPNMERPAGQGVRFSNFYAHNVCSPSRVSILTGQNAARHRTTDYIYPWKNNRLIDTGQYPLAMCQQAHAESPRSNRRRTPNAFPRFLRPYWSPRSC